MSKFTMIAGTISRNWVPLFCFVPVLLREHLQTREKQETWKELDISRRLVLHNGINLLPALNLSIQSNYLLICITLWE